MTNGPHSYAVSAATEGMTMVALALGGLVAHNRGEGYRQVAFLFAVLAIAAALRCFVSVFALASASD